MVASILSMVLPGAGQLYAGARRRGAVLLAVTAATLAALVVLASTLPVVVDTRLVALVLAADAVLLALRLFAVLDVWRGGVAGIAVLAALTAAPHVWAGYVTVRGYDVLTTVFADEEPCATACDRGDLLLAAPPQLPQWVAKDPWEWALVERLGPGEVAPLEADARVVATTSSAWASDRPWTTILLLGTDEGPGNWGARTDTIILVALQHGTGRAAAFGVPRNVAQVPLGPKGRPSKQPLNALYGLAGGGEDGAAVVKQAVSNLLGIRVDYYALVNLVGFADLVDALGGVEIHVKERLVDEVTRPAWGEPKPRIDVRPGEVRRFYGREALAYVRSRKDSSDYTRMARQRCFLSAMADQLDPVRVLRSFGGLARTIEANVRTDVPLDRLPSLVELVSAVDPAETLTVTFGPNYFFARRPGDNHPVPHLGKMQRTVRQAILTPEQLKQRGAAKTTRESC